MNSKLWNLLGAITGEATVPAAMSISAAGLCCAVGYRLPPAACAIRANMDHFQESDFLTSHGDPLLVARLPDDELWGQARLARWLEFAISECVKDVPDLDAAATPLLWLAPEPQRAGRGTDWYTGAFSQATERLGLHFHPQSGVLPHGRAGLAQALLHATRLFKQERPPRNILLAGCDSYLDAATINRYLEDERLQAPGNSDGFIPGEAAAAVLLQVSSRDAPGVLIIGVGEGDESGRPDGSVPSRAQGLTQAARVALDAAGIAYTDLDFRASDQNGEAFFSRESIHALTRLAPVGGLKLPLITLADSLGEVGAALGVAMLAYLSHVMPHDHGPGEYGLLHLANDDGRRCAVILRHVAETSD